MEDGEEAASCLKGFEKKRKEKFEKKKRAFVLNKFQDKVWL